MNNDELKHYGVPGMKWGHRKGTSGSSQTDNSGKTKKNTTKKSKKMSTGKKVATGLLAAYGTYLAVDFIKNRKEYMDNLSLVPTAIKLMCGKDITDLD